MAKLAIRRNEAPAIEARSRVPAACLAALAVCVSVGAQAPKPVVPEKPTYYEFGTVVSVGQRTILIATQDPQKQKSVQHSFALAGDSRADVVRPGDNVEVIFMADADWTIHRLILLNAPIPRPGPPPGDHREVPEAIGIHIVPSTSGSKTPAGSTRGVAIPTAPGVAAGAGAKTASARDVAIPSATSGSARTQSGGKSVELGITGKPPKSASVIDVPLGGDEVTQPKVAKPKEIAREAPLEECNRSSADWPTQPLRLAVLDFRYPTEREEAHDNGTTGGGSGTAVADLVFAALDQTNLFAMSRGDRTKLYRADFAGAARVGREIGADAVLAGTFVPVDPPAGSDPDFPPAKSYELRAGIVDSCTGQLLLRLTSVTCPDGMDPNAAANGPSCKRFAVTAKQATDPKEQAHAFQQPIEAMLNPLVHNGPPPGTQGTAGVVASANAGEVTIRLPSGSQVKAGDQVALHAWRLSKNPTTYTLHNLHDEEIGRVTVSAVQGGVASGTFTGDFPPEPGDTAELVTP